MTSPNIDFYIYFFQAKLCSTILTMLLVEVKKRRCHQNVYDLEGIFPLTDMYATQII